MDFGFDFHTVQMYNLQKYIQILESLESSDASEFMSEGFSYVTSAFSLCHETSIILLKHKRVSGQKF